MSITIKQPYGSCRRDGLGSNLVAGVALQAPQHGGKRHMRIFIQPGDSRFSTEGTMPTDVVAIMDVAGQIFSQIVKEPYIIALIKVPHVVAKCPFQLAVGLRMVHRRMDQTDT